MAIFRSSILADIRGSIGGSVYSRNRSGAIIRNRTNPINPNTAAQSIVRSRMADAANAFGLLSAADQTLWNDYAQLVPSFNSLGEMYTPTAKQRYIQSNLNLLTVGQPQAQTPELGVTTVPALDLSGLTLIGTVLAAEINALEVNGLVDAGDADNLVIQATPPLNAGRLDAKNLMRTIFAGAFVTDNDLITQYSARYGVGGVVATVGQRVNFRIRAIENKNGLASAWFYFSKVLTV